MPFISGTRTEYPRNDSKLLEYGYSNCWVNIHFIDNVISDHFEVCLVKCPKTKLANHTSVSHRTNITKSSIFQAGTTGYGSPRHYGFRGCHSIVIFLAYIYHHILIWLLSFFHQYMEISFKLASAQNNYCNHQNPLGNNRSSGTDKISRNADVKH